MMFFFKKKPIVLNCVTERQDVFTYAPVQRASKFLPSWWKSLPDSIIHNGGFYPSATMKHCVGFTELFKNGVMIPLWSDLALKIGPRGSNYGEFRFADTISTVQGHPTEQHNNEYKETDFQHIKLWSPWNFSCDEEISFLCIEPTWSLLNIPNVRVVPGVLEFKYQSATNQNFFIKRDETEQNFIIPFLTPLMHIIPLSERPLKIVLSQDKDLIKKSMRGSYGTKFVNKYKTNKKFLMEKNN